MYRLFLLVFLFSAVNAQSQENIDTMPDSTGVAGIEVSMTHSPKKATILSAVLPGAGQIYNRKYWKVPIVLAGLGTCVYFIQDNSMNYNYFKDNLIAELDDDPATVNETEYNSTQLDQIQDTYRRWLDLSWMSLGIVYILNIIDANVDAHLFYFDVGDDLSLNIRPYMHNSTGIRTGLSLSLNF